MVVPQHGSKWMVYNGHDLKCPTQKMIIHRHTPFTWHVCKNLFQYQNIGAVIGHPIWNLHSLFISNHYMFTRFWLVFFSSSFTATTWFKKCWKREGILDVKFHCVVTRHSEFVVSDVQCLLHIRWMQSVSHYRWSHLEWTFSQPILFSHNRQTKYHTTSIGTCSPFCLQSWHQWYPKKRLCMVCGQVPMIYPNPNPIVPCRHIHIYI